MKKLSKNLQRLFIGLVIFVMPTFALAASLYIDPAMNKLNRGDAVTMSVRLDVDEEAGECVNAVDAVISYSDNIEPVDVTVGDSIFSIWVEKPTINKEARTITFAGGTPNGYCGRVAGDPRLTNTLAKLVFRSPGFTINGSDNNIANVDFMDASNVYLNDGFGTQVAPAKYGATIELAATAGPTLENPWKDEVDADDIAPEEFSISLQKDEKAFSQKYYIVFNTTDKQTGIDHYEVMEEALTQVGAFQWGRADAPWIEARSPYVLKDQSLNSIIRVKAVDKAGNERMANLVPEENMRTISREQMLMFVGGGALLLMLAIISFIFIRVIRKRREKKNALTASTESSEELDNETEALEENIQNNHD